RAFTSQKTSSRSRRSTRSISPSRRRQLRSTTAKPRSSYHRAATASPCAPSPRRWSDFGLWELFDIHVLEGQDANGRDESGLAVHVPDPSVGQLHLDEGSRSVALHSHLDAVRQVEAALGLDRISEHRADVAILLCEGELALGLIGLEIFGAQTRFSLTLAALPTRSRR